MFAPSRSRRILSPACLLVVGLMMAGLRPAAAADLDRVAPPLAAQGVACAAPDVQGFSSVWLGHFTGGASAYPGPGSSIFLDWRDEKRCFPNRRFCNRWIGEMRHAFHHPEGFYTCLAIR